VEPIYLRTDSGTRHWCLEGPGYPSMDAIVDTRTQRPEAGEKLCEQCSTLERDGRCSV
jgi:hypothetical protein